MEVAENSMRLAIAAERFAVNNKLVYTSDEARKAALTVEKDADADYQLLVTDFNTLYATGKSLEAQIEFERKQFRGVEIAMSFYALNPTTT